LLIVDSVQVWIPELLFILGLFFEVGCNNLLLILRPYHVHCFDFWTRTWKSPYHSEVTFKHLSLFLSVTCRSWLMCMCCFFLPSQIILRFCFQVFFPSYAWMDACVNHWQTHGQWERLVQVNNFNDFLKIQIVERLKPVLWNLLFYPCSFSSL
jgi:hypothetical protein